MSVSTFTGFANYLAQFVSKEGLETNCEEFGLNDRIYHRFTNSFWTAKQRQSNRLHEIAYRACFKAELPNFFIHKLSSPGDIVYDPFSGRGTTVLEAALLGRNIISNDANPLNEILCKPRLFLPDLKELEQRLHEILDPPLNAGYKPQFDMFYHEHTEKEIFKLKSHYLARQSEGKLDDLDRWIQMVATNRLTGHSSGFFSIYTLPPNQAISPERQQKINRDRNQEPDYRNTLEIILKKSAILISQIDNALKQRLAQIGASSKFLNCDAAETHAILDNTVQLTVTSPPFLDVVQYASDNWLRCWFSGINEDEVAKKITMARTEEAWAEMVGRVMKELYRITKPGGYVAFEVGEVRKGKIRLENSVIPAGQQAGFTTEALMINQQSFTKTANIWGIKNNNKGTNTNRIAVFKKSR